MGTSGPQAPLGAAVGSSQHGRRPPPLSMHIGHRGCGHLSPVGLRPAASMELEQKKKKKTLKKKAPVAGHDREDIGFRWPDPPRSASEQVGGGHSKSPGSKFFRARRAQLASVVLGWLAPHRRNFQSPAAGPLTIGHRGCGQAPAVEEKFERL